MCGSRPWGERNPAPPPHPPPRQPETPVHGIIVSLIAVAVAIPANLILARGLELSNFHAGWDHMWLTVRSPRCDLFL
jgi:hypothetical protein